MIGNTLTAGVPSSDVATIAYFSQLFSGLDHAARSRPVTGFDELVGEHSTEGGLNEQVLEGHRKVNLSAIDLCDLSA